MFKYIFWLRMKTIGILNLEKYKILFFLSLTILTIFSLFEFGIFKYGTTMSNLLFFYETYIKESIFFGSIKGSSP